MPLLLLLALGGIAWFAFSRDAKAKSPNDEQPEFIKAWRESVESSNNPSWIMAGALVLEREGYQVDADEMKARARAIYINAWSRAALDSGDPAIMRAAASVLEKEGLVQHAAILRAASGQQGAAHPESLPPGTFYLEQGQRYRAALLLSGAECLAGTGTIANVLGQNGFAGAQVYNAKDVPWQPPKVPTGFFECSRFAEAIWNGPNSAKEVPEQVYSVVKV